MNVNEMKERKYLSEPDVTPPVVMTIRRLEKQNLALPGEAQKAKWVVFFDEHAKGLVLNSTNISRIAKALLAEDTDSWIGKKITLYFDENVEYAGKLVGGIRVKRAPQAASPADGLREAIKPKASHVDDLDSDIPF